MPVFFADTGDGTIGIFDARPTDRATDTTPRVWLDAQGTAIFVRRDRPAPADKPTYTSHWATCKDRQRFTDEKTEREIQRRMSIDSPIVDSEDRWRA